MTHYIGNSEYKHETPSCTGVLLVNLGTPDAPTRQAVRRYLAEFLSDRRVIEVPKMIWWFILYGFILNFRPARTAKNYKKIWTDEGSPLLAISKKLSEGIQNSLDKHAPDKYKVVLAMRYGKPSIESGLETLRQLNARNLLVFPLYPQYSATTTASTFDAVSNILKTWRWLPEIKMINHYHDEDTYITALAQSISEHWSSHGQAEKLVISFHGIPKAYFDAGDPYYCECHKTARLLTEKLGLKDEQWILTFQSRFGPKDWLQPYTDVTLKSLAQSGIKKINIICPGFSADCLETLEEINIQNRNIFLTAGGEEFSYVPALNAQPSHINLLTEIILKQQL